MQVQRLTGFKVADASPALSHLFFADDTFIFCKANKEDADSEAIWGSLEQIVNVEKSSVFFGKNTGEDRKLEVLSVLGA